VAGMDLLQPRRSCVNARLMSSRSTTPIEKEFHHGDLDSAPYRRPLGPCLLSSKPRAMDRRHSGAAGSWRTHDRRLPLPFMAALSRSEEHTSELQSRENIV